MIENLPGEAEALRAAKAEPLGVLPQPNELPRGCIAAGDRAFFCDYVQEYLSRAGISKEQVATGGYLIRTTLDPEVQAPVKAAIDKYASPNLAGISSVMSVIKPGKDAHKVLAMASNRKYGLDLEAGETMRPQPFSLVGDAPGLSSRSSPRPLLWTWAWVLTPNSTCRPDSRPKVWEVAGQRGAPKRPGVW